MITDLRYAIRQITIARNNVAAPATSALARAIDALRRIEEQLVDLSAGVGTYSGMTPAEVVTTLYIRRAIYRLRQYRHYIAHTELRLSIPDEQETREDRDRYNILCDMPNKALEELYLEVMSDYDPDPDTTIIQINKLTNTPNALTLYIRRAIDRLRQYRNYIAHPELQLSIPDEQETREICDRVENILDTETP